MEKPIKAIEICVAGDSSVLGTIYMELREAVEEMTKYQWIIFVNTGEFDFIEDQCKKLKLQYILADRRTMRTPKKN